MRQAAITDSRGIAPVPQADSSSGGPSRIHCTPFLRRSLSVEFGGSQHAALIFTYLTKSGLYSETLMIGFSGSYGGVLARLNAYFFGNQLGTAWFDSAQEVTFRYKNC